MSTDNDISVLNGLIKTTLDSMKVYEDAAKDAESTQYATMFADFARDRSQVATALQAHVRTLGAIRNWVPACWAPRTARSWI